MCQRRIDSNGNGADGHTDLVLRAQSGDRVAFGALYEKFQNPVFTVALRSLRNWSDAEELTGEVFMHAFEKLSQLKEPGAFPGWLRTITRRMVLDFFIIRRTRALTVDPERLAETYTITEDPGTALDRAEEDEQLHARMDGLSPLDRETLTAFYFQHRSTRCA